jgi:hypothetical protein
MFSYTHNDNNNNNNNNNNKGRRKGENVAVPYQLMHYCLISELHSSLSGAGRTWFRVHDTAQVIWREITSTGKAATEKKTINSPQNTGNRCSLFQGFTEFSTMSHDTLPLVWREGCSTAIKGSVM